MLTVLFSRRKLHHVVRWVVGCTPIPEKIQAGFLSPMSLRAHTAYHNQNIDHTDIRPVGGLKTTSTTVSRCGYKG